MGRGRHYPHVIPPIQRLRRRGRTSLSWRKKTISVIRLFVHGACATPALLLLAGWFNNRLGVDPEKTLIWESGIWTFNLLLVVLLLPIVANWTQWPTLHRYRRAVGLWAFSYATCHFLFFITFLLGWDLARLGEELQERPYIVFGFSAWLILVAMAATSNRAAIRWLRKKWRVLHLWVYAAAGLAAIHYLLMVRSHYGWAGTYAGIVILLITARFIRVRKRQTTRDR